MSTTWIPNISYYSVGYLNLRLWSRQLFTYPADPGGRTPSRSPTSPPRSRPQDNGGISADGKTYTIKIRPGCEVEHHPGPPGDRRRHGPRREAHREPGPAVRRHPRLRRPDRRVQGVLRRLRQGGQDAGRDRRPTSTRPRCPGVVAKDDTTVVFHLTQPATYFVDMLTLPAFSPAPVEVLKYLPASTELGKHYLSDGPYKVDSWSPTKSITYSPQPCLGRRAPTRSARRTSTRSWSTRPSARTRSSSSCRPARRRADMEFDVARRRRSCPR